MKKIENAIGKRIIYHCDEKKYRYELGKACLEDCTKDILSDVTKMMGNEIELLQKENAELKSKLIPVEPNWVYEDEPICPYCSEILDESDDYNACSHCGQVIDWRNW